MLTEFQVKCAKANGKPRKLADQGGLYLYVTPQGVRPGAWQFDDHRCAFRWRKLLETGVHATVEEIAAAEKINASYVSRVLRLKKLVPDIVD
jgi:hypothetical protein